MIPSLQRPSFFPGQWIDYRDLNRLAQHPGQVLALLNRAVFQRGGVLLTASDEFRITPAGGLSVRIHPGVAVLPNGEIVSLTAPVLFDLAPYLPSSGTRCLRLAVHNRILGTDRHVDENDPTIEGFRTEVFEPVLEIEDPQAESQGLELCRIWVSPEARTVRMAEAEEEWNTDGVFEGLAAEAILDLRFRPTVLPITYQAVESGELIGIRKALYRIDDSLRAARKIYFIDDPFQVSFYITQLHAEILSRPFQPIKTSFLLSEFSEKCSLFLEYLEAKLGRQPLKYDRPTLMGAAEVLKTLRNRELLPRTLSLGTLTQVSDLLKQFIDYAEHRFSMVDMVEEALLDLRFRSYPYNDTILLAGYPFRRSDLVTSKDSSLVRFLADPTHTRTIHARYATGESQESKGVFMKNGTIEMPFHAVESQNTAVVLLRQYRRRAGTKVEYEVNGRKVKSASDQVHDHENEWFNEGLVVPAEYLSADQNVLRIRVEKADLDFGFFEAAVYQPSETREGKR